MDSRTIGLVLVSAGVLVVLIGLVVMTGALSWFGRLPGDIHVSNGNAHIYIPITSMLIVSVALSLVSLVAKRLL